jgi:transposase
MSIIAFVGLDVHQDTIAVHGLPLNGDTALLQCTIKSDRVSVKKHFTKWSSKFELHCCYEASQCGYVLYRQLTEMGIDCVVIAPSLVPQKAGDRVKTDKRDAKKLCRGLRNGDLTSVLVPTVEQESDRRLVRYRTTLVRQIVRLKNHVLKFLAQLGLRSPYKANWTDQHYQWLRDLKLCETDTFIMSSLLGSLEHANKELSSLEERLSALAQSQRYRPSVGKLMGLRGIRLVSAMTLLTEIIDFKRFGSPRQLMSFLGLVPSESSSGSSRRQGSITKAGNTLCRYVIVEAARHYQRSPGLSKALKQRQAGLDPEVVAHCQKAQERLHKKYWSVANRKEKDKGKAVVATGRELIGFIWAIMNDHMAPRPSAQPGVPHRVVSQEAVFTRRLLEIRDTLALADQQDPELAARLRMHMTAVTA